MGKPHTEYRQKITINVDGSRTTTSTGSGACTCSSDDDHTRLMEIVDLREENR